MGETFKFSYKDRTRESLTLGVYNCGAQKCGPGEAWGEGVRDHYLIHYVRSGRGCYRTGEALYTLGENDLFIVYPGDPIRYWADEEEPWEYVWVGFNGSEANYLLKRTDFQRNRPVLHLEDDRLRPALQAILDAHGGSLFHQTRMIGRLYEFLSLLIELSSSGGAPEGGFDYVGSATKFIAYNYASPIDVSTIAQNIGVSRSHLYRVFVKSLGVTPNEYLTRYRISQACALLAGSSLPVSSVANSVGYEDPLYFSRVFKRITGLSPRAYLAGRRAPESAESGSRQP
ncbi:MAG: AraC family transcriptional regulator [Provencibacterium sp.]|jgi:AraC-like DNA-binding protein|nr:AraC family transcriptional regulator [Provencibacterium sp.]